MKRPTVVVLTLSGALALGACASGGSSGRTASSAGASAGASAAVTVKGPTVDLASLMATSSAAVRAKKTVHMVMSSGGSDLVEDVRYDGSSSAVRMTMNESGHALTLVYIDKVLYMGGDLIASMAGGRTWVKIDPNGTDAFSQSMKSTVDAMASSAANPVEALATVTGVTATQVSKTATTTTYHVALSVDQLKAMVKSQASGIPGLSAQTASTATSGLTYDITLDRDNLPTTMRLTLGGQPATMTFTKWGEPVDISAPAASEIGRAVLPTASASPTS